jgi:hypothetical protein
MIMKCAKPIGQSNCEEGTIREGPIYPERRVEGVSLGESQVDVIMLACCCPKILTLVLSDEAYQPSNSASKLARAFRVAMSGTSGYPKFDTMQIKIYRVLFTR